MDQFIQQIFTGLSIGSILLLVALAMGFVYLAVQRRQGVLR